MKMMRVLALTVPVLLGACGTGPVTSPSPSPSATPTTPAYAVLVNQASNEQGRFGGPISLIGADGKVVASVQRPFEPPAGFQLPQTSASSTRVYYLQGCCEVHFLTPAGETGVTTRLPGTAQAQVVFAVSPDDKRIAVSVLERTAEAFFTLTHVRLYVEDLAGGAHHVDLFSSNSDFVWPVGWHGGNVVVAVGPPAVQSPAPNPYSAFGGYRLIDPGTGAVRAILATDFAGAKPCLLTGPLSPAGSACSQGQQGWVAVDWRGVVSHRFPAQGPADGYGALSPSGDKAAVCCGSGPPASDPGSFQGIIGPAGNVPIAVKGTWWNPGWIDETHLVIRVSPPYNKFTNPTPLPDQVFVYDLVSRAMIQVADVGFYAGRLPGDLG
jgi:hypothetical protein